MENRNNQTTPEHVINEKYKPTGHDYLYDEEVEQCPRFVIVRRNVGASVYFILNLFELIYGTGAYLLETLNVTPRMVFQSAAAAARVLRPNNQNNASFTSSMYVIFNRKRKHGKTDEQLLSEFKKQVLKRFPKQPVGSVTDAVEVASPPTPEVQQGLPAGITVQKAVPIVVSTEVSEAYIHEIIPQVGDSGDAKLQQLEARLMREQDANCFALGAILKEINDRRLYRGAGFNSFRQYMDSNSGRFNISGKTAERWIKAVELVSLLPESAAKPVNVYHIYDLRYLHDHDVGKCWLMILLKVKNNAADVTTAIIKHVLADAFSYALPSSGMAGSRSAILVGPKAAALYETDPAVSTNSNNWYTPPHILVAVREVFGGDIDLDPCSDDDAQRTVQAVKFFSLEDDGLNECSDWRGNVFVNPPYSLAASGVGMQELFLSRAIREFNAGHVNQCILLLRCSIGYRWFDDVMKHPHCFLRDRLAFVNGSGGAGAIGSRPVAPFGSVVCYLGHHADKFVRVFASFGYVPGHNSWACNP